MKRALTVVVNLGLMFFTVPSFAARPVVIDGVRTVPLIETKMLPSGMEGLPIWFLPRLGIEVLANSASEVYLRKNGIELRYTSTGGWQEMGQKILLPVPELYHKSRHGALSVLVALKLSITDGPEQFGIALASSNSLPKLQPDTLSTLTVVRSSRTVERNKETQRVVLEFSTPVAYQPISGMRGVHFTVIDSKGSSGQTKLESGDWLDIRSVGTNLEVHLKTRREVQSKVLLLEEPFRIVIDTVTQVDPTKTPPPNLAKLPPGVQLRQFGTLSLLSFDPLFYEPKVVTSRAGKSVSVYEHVKSVGGVAGVNGGYFDPKTELAVDLVARAGVMLASSLEKRAAVGFSKEGVLFGFPKPRSVLKGDWGQLTVNTVSAKANPNWVSLFVGDGYRTVGATGMTTLVLEGSRVTKTVTKPFIPNLGEVTVTLDPQRYPQLPCSLGSSISLNLDWKVDGWDAVEEALAAGPLLIENGRIVIDPVREGFNTKTNIWRPTRQVAFALYQGQPTIAYLEYGTPDDFAEALYKAKVDVALRLDSGSSATVYVAEGYLNTVWSRIVPNAIVFVPKVAN